MATATAPSRAWVVVAASLVAVAASLLLTAPDARANALKEITIPARNGEVDDDWLPYPGPPRAFVLLPDGYDRHEAYPLLTLLSGLNSDYTSWPTGGNIEETAAGLDAIVVMPEGGSGWYTDWWNDGKRGDPAWESYILDQVVPQIEERYEIRSKRRWHALAGVSMGGLGAAYLGGRLPGYYGSMVSISGLVDLEHYPHTNQAQSVLSELFYGQDTDPEAVSGPYGSFYARGHNPPNLAANLRHTRVWMGSGDGTPIPGDDIARPNWPYDAAAEAGIIRPVSDSYHAALKEAGVDVTYSRRPGGHTWPNFQGELRDAIDWGLFEPVAEHPRSWVNDTVAGHGKLWEFAYRFDAPPDRIVHFRRRGGRLRVSAAGSPVTIKTRGCSIQRATPASIRVPRRSCGGR